VSLGSSPDEPLTIDDLFAEYEASLQRYAYTLVYDLDRVDDLVQETMIRAMGNLWLLGQMNPWQRRAWLYRVLRNRFIDEERTRTRQAKLMEYLPDHEPAADNHLETDIFSTILKQAPEKYRELLRAYYSWGKSTEEIATELGIPPATVRSRLFLARKWLREHRNEII
jgi:RNA polymerase sigma-70 factor (ECF subfamily)